MSVALPWSVIGECVLPYFSFLFEIRMPMGNAHDECKAIGLLKGLDAAYGDNYIFFLSRNKKRKSIFFGRLEQKHSDQPIPSLPNIW